MSKRKTSRPAEEPSAEALRAASLPDSREELLSQAIQAQQQFHAAVLAGDRASAAKAALWANAIVFKLNDGTMFGSYADEDSPGKVIDRLCAAVPGSAPQWGQHGVMVVTACGVRAIVCVTGDGMHSNLWLEFRALDLDRPFISETGYRACLNVGFDLEDEDPGRMTIEQVAIQTLTELIHAEKSKHGGKHGLLMVDQAAHESASEFIASCTWLRDTAIPEPDQTYELRSGQVAFAF